MNCLCCGKPIRSGNGESGWHKSCIKRFFGTVELPEIDINDEALEKLAVESTGKGYTVPGVQKKLSLHLFSGRGHSRLTLVDYPNGYILKPQVEQFEALPEAEHLVMCMADAAGISTVPHALIREGDNLAYITKRADRIFERGNMKMLAMEDFCQLDMRLTQDKYKGSYERCAKIIDRCSSRKGLDITELFMRLVFSFMIGNSDMHLKNFSLIETDEGSMKYVLSPAYDLLPVNVIMPEDTEQMALPLNGKKANLKRRDFLEFAVGCGIGDMRAEKMIDMLLSKEEMLISMCNGSLLPEYMKEHMSGLIRERIGLLNNERS